MIAVSNSSPLMTLARIGELKLLSVLFARPVAMAAGLNVVGCTGVLEAGARQSKVTRLRSACVELLRQGIRFDLRLLQDRHARLGLLQL